MIYYFQKTPKSKVKKRLIVFLYFSLMELGAASQKKLVHGCRNAGMYSILHNALSAIAWHDHTKIPLAIYWDSTCLYYQPEGYNGIVDNAFEYYFEPITNTCFFEKNDAINQQNPASLTINSFQNVNSTDPIYRKWVHYLIKKYLKLKEPVQRKIDTFYQNKMAGKFNIGIHCRSYTHRLEADFPDYLTFFDIANKTTRNYKNVQFLVASDEPSVIEQAKKNLQAPVICYDSIRLGGEMHDQKLSNKAKLGEDIIIEANLLSKCDIFIHGLSNVSSFVLHLNPCLKHIRLGSIKPLSGFGFHETACRTFENYLPPNPIIVEVGASYGHHTVALSKLRPQAKIFACEPNKDSYQELGKLESSTIKTFNIALSGRSGLAKFLNLGWLSSLKKPTDALHQMYIKTDDIVPRLSTVNCLTLDDLCKKCNIHHIDLLWLDAGGSELEILQNFSKLNEIDIIYTNASGVAFWKNGATCQGLESFLLANNFTMCWSFTNDWEGRALFMKKNYKSR